MGDRELLTLAAKAAGLVVNVHKQAARDALIGPETASLWLTSGDTGWNPLRNDGDALRLAVKLGLLVGAHPGPEGDTWVQFYRLDEDGWRTFKETHGDDPYVATRRAIVRAAAEIGKATP